MGDNIFRQLIGVPMGVEPAPYIADLTLWFFEIICYDLLLLLLFTAKMCEGE